MQTFKFLIVVVNTDFNGQLKPNIGNINTVSKRIENSKNIHPILSYLDSNESSRLDLVPRRLRIIKYDSC